MPAFHEWLEHRVEEVPDIGSLALVIAKSGMAGVSLDSLRRSLNLPPDTLAGLVATGQVVVLKVNGEMRYRAAG